MFPRHFRLNGGLGVAQVKLREEIKTMEKLKTYA